MPPSHRADTGPRRVFAGHRPARPPCTHGPVAAAIAGAEAREPPTELGDRGGRDGSRVYSAGKLVTVIDGVAA
jgi:hypothetical protein